MDLRQLRYFLAVAEELHFGRAAERAHIAQSPLSRQIKQLEESLGVSLFLRTKRRVELTEAGRAFLPEAKAVLLAAVQAQSTAVRAQAGLIGRLSLGFTNSAIYTALPQVLAVYRRKYPQVELILHESMLTHGQVDALLNKQLDLGFLRPPLKSQDIGVLPFARERLVVALPKEHPLATGAKVDVKALAGEPLILFSRDLDSSLSMTIIGICHDAGFHPRIVQEVGDVPTMIMLVSSGMGMALVPSSSKNIQMKGVVFRSLTTATPTLNLALAWNQKVESPIRDSFLSIAQEVLKE